ncbi:hypothetical protein [Lactococcus phage Nocturne116]|nr:hypothetical protein [Lactococcus phage Nocturne116]
MVASCEMLNISTETRNELTLGELTDLINFMAPPEEKKKQSKTDLREALRNG